MLRFVIALIKHETNTFSPLSTPLSAFGHGNGPSFGDAARARFAGTNTPMGAYLDIAERAGGDRVAQVSGGRSGDVSSRRHRAPHADDTGAQELCALSSRFRAHRTRGHRRGRAGARQSRSDHVHMVALYTVWYNYARINSAVRMAPAMAAGISDRLWDVADIVRLVETHEAKL